MHRNWIAVSDWIGRETQKKFGLSSSSMSVVYNPVNSCEQQQGEALAGLPKNFVLYAGTVSDRKGAFVLAEAGRLFLDKNSDLHLVYIGSLIIENGRRADETIRQILGKKLVNRVHFTGPVHHDVVIACMKRARVFAFPSKLEAFGLVPVEAMTCGVPVVYSTLHAGPEVIDDGVTGLLADPYSPADVAMNVMRLLDDASFAAQLSKNALKAVKERFSLQKSVDKTICFYKSVIFGKKIIPK